MSTKLAGIATKAKKDRKARFTSLAHIITPEFLKETWKMMNRRGASGVDGETTKQFESQLDARVQDIWMRMKENRYKAPPVESKFLKVREKPGLWVYPLWKIDWYKEQ